VPSRWSLAPSPAQLPWRSTPAAQAPSAMLCASRGSVESARESAPGSVLGGRPNSQVSSPEHWYPRSVDLEKFRWVLCQQGRPGVRGRMSAKERQAKDKGPATEIGRAHV